MSDIKRVKNFNRSRRTGKVIETLEARQKRETAFLLELERLADKVLAKRLSGEPSNVPTANELAEMKRTKPEVFEMLDALDYVAEKVGNLPPVPTGEEYDGSTIIQKMDGSRIKYNLDGSQEILNDSAPAATSQLIGEADTVQKPENSELLPPEMPAEVADIASIVRAKNFRR